MMEELVNRLGRGLRGVRGVKRCEITLPDAAIEVVLQCDDAAQQRAVTALLDLEANVRKAPVVPECVQQHLLPGLARDPDRNVDRQSGLLQDLRAIVLADRRLFAFFLMELEEPALAARRIDDAVDRVEAGPVGADRCARDGQAELIRNELGDRELRFSAASGEQELAAPRRGRGRHAVLALT
jgi:hypothetical protein